ncbi:hypothetical protein [Aminobacter sp. SS-2016]|uniref:hypothetical protein n=1 Tax=Aminobacter sp. Y103A TaxID=1870862 RepID=UPI0025741636|nr:hypothetical protein [Aminobacter sp. SS-2016]
MKIDNFLQHFMKSVLAVNDGSDYHRDDAYTQPQRPLCTMTRLNGHSRRPITRIVDGECVQADRQPSLQTTANSKNPANRRF